MTKQIKNIYRLGIKELFSLRYDPVMVFLIIYFFTVAVYMPATSSKMDVRNASVAMVDEDRSHLSHRIKDALLLPYFQPPQYLETHEIDGALDSGRYTFVIDIPPDFQADVLAGHRPDIQVNVDATTMSQAGRGATYIQSIISQEVMEFVPGNTQKKPVTMAIRAKFNPNLEESRFAVVMQIINNINMLAILLTGAALIREREHGTIEHLLVMPLRPIEIILAKVWSSGLVIVIATTVSLWVVVQWLLEVPIAGSITLFLMGTVFYLFSVTSLGIFLSTLARSMPQFGLLAIPVFIIMNLLSGSATPLDSMPEWLQHVMQLSPSTHFVSFAQAVLYRGAGIEVVWPKLVVVTVIGSVLFFLALVRFRASVAATQA